MVVIDVWCILFWVQLITFICIISIVTYKCYKALDTKANELTIEKLHNELNSINKDMIINKHENELRMAYIKIAQLEAEIKSNKNVF